MRKNRLKLFGLVERTNNQDIAKKINEIRMEGNQERSKSKNKYICVIDEDMRAYRIYVNMV